MASGPQVQKQAAGQAPEPPNFGEIRAALQEARAMLDWGDNWDGEGSPGYSAATWERAADFLAHSATELWQRHSRAIPVPDIAPGPNGSFDFHWQVSDRELLLNLPANLDSLVDFYGDTSDGESIKGRAHASTVGPWILAWLTR